MIPIKEQVNVKTITIKLNYLLKKHFYISKYSITDGECTYLIERLAYFYFYFISSSK